METLSSNLTSQEVVQQRAGIPGIEAPPQPDATTADQGKVNVLALPVRPQESQVKLSLKTAGMVLLTVPFLTVSSFLLQVAQFRADLPSLELLHIKHKTKGCTRASRTLEGGYVTAATRRAIRGFTIATTARNVSS